jgi:hypothetical protein
MCCNMQVPLPTKKLNSWLDHAPAAYILALGDTDVEHCTTENAGIKLRDELSQHHIWHIWLDKCDND